MCVCVCHTGSCFSTITSHLHTHLVTELLSMFAFVPTISEAITLSWSELKGVRVSVYVFLTLSSVGVEKVNPSYLPQDGLKT